MLRDLLLVPLVLYSTIAAAVDLVVPVKDVAGFFAALPADVTRVSFSAAAVYRCNVDIVLPDRQLLVIDGAGAKLILGPNSNGFTRRIVDQADAQKRTGSRYVIRDFAAIEGGRKAIDLQATLGSAVMNCRLTGQTDAAVDLRFALMTRVENVIVTNPAKRGFVVRVGDWPGATWSNSQAQRRRASGRNRRRRHRGAGKRIEERSAAACARGRAKCDRRRTDAGAGG
jgi:hypothetical protein